MRYIATFINLLWKTYLIEDLDNEENLNKIESYKELINALNTDNNQRRMPTTGKKKETVNISIVVYDLFLSREKAISQIVIYTYTFTQITG